VEADHATGASGGNSRALILLEERGVVRFAKMAVAIRTGKYVRAVAPPVLATANPYNLIAKICEDKSIT